MILYEYQVKQIFEKNALPVLKGGVAYTPSEAQEVATKIGGTRWYVKAQVSQAIEGGKNKPEQAPVRLAKSLGEVFQIAEQMLADTVESSIGWQRVQRVYIEEAVQIEQKIRVSIQVDFDHQEAVFVFENSKGKIYRYPIPEKGLSNGFICKCLAKLNLSYRILKRVCECVRRLYQLFLKYEAIAVQMNPLVLTADNKIVVLDGSIIFDADALFKHPDIMRIKDEEGGREREMIAKQNNFKYTTLDGNIACLVNGSGLGLATIDLIHASKGEVACLLDVGTEPTKEIVAKAFRLVLTEPNIEGVLVNIFGGTTRCDIIAKGLIAAAQEIAVGMPIVVRMDGMNAQIGERFLIESGLPFIITHTMRETICETVEKVQVLS